MPAQHGVMFRFGEVVCHVGDWHLSEFGDPAAWDRWSDCGLWHSCDFLYSGEYLPCCFLAEVWVTSFIFKGNNEEFHPFIAKPVVKHS